jgi:hypothetical protein
MTDFTDHMNDPTLISLVQALQVEDDLGAVIRAHLFVENELEQFIGLRMPGPVDGVLAANYRAKVNIAVALGLPLARKGALEQIGKIRNKFAHDLNFALTDTVIKDFWNSFGEEGQAAIRKSLEGTRTKLLSQGTMASDATMTLKDHFSAYAVGVWSSVRVENNRWRREHLQDEQKS